jgi:hypothetical protein
VETWCVLCEVGTYESLRTSGPRSVRVGFMTDQVALRQVFLRVRLFCPVIIILPTLHTHLYLHDAFVIRTNRRSLGTFPKAMFFPQSGSIKKEECLCQFSEDVPQNVVQLTDLCSAPLLPVRGRSSPVHCIHQTVKVALSTQRRRMEERMYSFTHSQPRHYVGVSGALAA